MARLPLSLLCLTLACAIAPAGAVAAELGEAKVASHIGQQLVADIELTSVRDEAAPVQVRVASADVYRGAGLAVPAVVAGLNFSVAKRGGRQYLHVTSLAPVQAEYLHLYLELAEGSDRSVRLATLWLTPDPKPAPPPAPVLPAAPVEAAKAVAPVVKPEPKIVPKPELKPEAKKPEPAPVKLAAAPEAPKPVAAVAKPKVKPVVAAPVAPLAKVNSAWVPASAGTTVAASCARPDPAALKTCVALDYKNAQLNTKIGQLEDKVKVLQVAIAAKAAADARAQQAPPPHPAIEPARKPQAKPATKKTPPGAELKFAAAVPEPQPQPSAAVKPATIPAITPRVKIKRSKPAPEPEQGLPWMWLALGGVAVLAAAGAAWAVVVRRRKAELERQAKAARAALPPVMSGVKNRLMPDTASRIEPSELEPATAE